MSDVHSYLAAAVRYSPTDVLEAHLEELRREISNLTDQIHVASWGGIRVETGLRYHRALARKSLAEAEFREINLELQRRRSGATETEEGL